MQRDSCRLGRRLCRTKLGFTDGGVPNAPGLESLGTDFFEEFNLFAAEFGEIEE